MLFSLLLKRSIDWITRKKNETGEAGPNAEGLGRKRWCPGTRQSWAVWWVARLLPSAPLALVCAVLYDSYIGSSNAFLTHDVALLRNLKCLSVFKDKFPDSSTGISVSSLTWPQPLPSQPGHLCERRGHWLPPLDPTPKPDLMVCPPTDPPARYLCEVRARPGPPLRLVWCSHPAGLSVPCTPLALSAATATELITNCHSCPCLPRTEAMAFVLTVRPLGLVSPGQTVQ